MKDRYLARQLAQLAFTANATRPIPGGPASLPAFFAGWLTAELAPHLAALTAVDAGVHVARHGLGKRRDQLGAVAALASTAAYASLIAAGQRAKGEVEDALVESLGGDYAEHLGRAADPLDHATPWGKLLWPFRMRHVDVTGKRHVPYSDGGRRFELDVYHHRDKPEGRPVLLQVHGGGWVIGTKEQQGIPLMMHMAAQDWVCVAVNYPLSPRARWPEHLIAVNRAIGWIRENITEYGGDPNFVAVTGGSAGAHIAAMAALTSADKSLQPGFEEIDTSLQACVPHYGVYDFTAESGTKSAKQRLDVLLRPLVMARGAKYPDDFRAASPLSRVGEDVPPFFVVHGRNDTLVPVREARSFVDKLRAASANPVAYAEIGGAQHAFDLFPSIRSAHVVRGVQRFLDWTYNRAAEQSVPDGSAPRQSEDALSSD